MKKFILTILLFLSAGLSLADYNMKEDKQMQINFFRNLAEKLENNIVINNFNIEIIKKRLKDIDEQVIFLSGLLKNPEGNESRENLLLQEAEIIYKKEKVDKLKNEFKKRILWLYKNGIDYQTQILFTSESPVSFYSRLEYLNKMSGMRKKDFERIKFEEYSIQEKKKLITLDQFQRRKYISMKKLEEDELLNQKIVLEDSLILLKFNNESYARQIERIKSAVEQMQNHVSSLSTNFIYKIDDIKKFEGSFEDNKGKLAFPVQSVDIIRDFGRGVNPQTGTIAYNFGIDVSIAAGSLVKAVFEGEVEEIIEIPYYRKIIVINHNEGYRTIYGLVSDIAVQKGSKVQAGDVIAHTSHNASEQLFHFEIRKDFEPVDPKIWIKIGYTIFVKI